MAVLSMSDGELRRLEVLRDLNRQHGLGRLILFFAPRTAELLTILPYDRRRRFQANANPAPLVHIGTFSGNPPNDILSRQDRWHLRAPTSTLRFQRVLFRAPGPGFSSQLLQYDQNALRSDYTPVEVRPDLIALSCSRISAWVARVMLLGIGILFAAAIRSATAIIRSTTARSA